ncbi:MAG: hypothetical protein ABL867_03000 [Rickettsiales bacterium]
MTTEVKIAKPRTAKSFAGLWNNSGEDTVINGNAELPDMYRRQNRLVGQVLDACIILHVYEQLKQGNDFDSLEKLLPKKFSKEEFAELAKTTDDKKLHRLVEMAKEKKPVEQLKNHRLLVTKKDWQNYTTAFREYLWESIKREEKIKDLPGSHDAVTIPAEPIMPEDPRIIAVNEKIKPTIQLLNCGPKAHKAIDKKAKRKGSDISELRDINRVGVLPTKLEYAKDFIKIMELLNPDKAITDKEDGHKIIPRLYEEQPEVRLNGYYNQKLFVAQDRCLERDKITRGNEGTVAEIKIVPAAMHVAEKLSAAIKQVLNMFDGDKIYISDNPADVAQIQENRRELEKELAKQKPAFTAIAKKNDLEHYVDKWPKFDKKKENDPKTYKKLKNDLIELATEIHVDAMLNEHRTWKEEYLRTAIIQKLSRDPKKNGHINGQLPTDITLTDRLGKSWLERIAESGHLDLKQIEKEVKIEMGLSKPKQAQAHSR